jgi:uncharacterized membrane protein YqgA involved in biofilm formation
MDEKMDEELADIARRISQLASQAETNEKKSKGPFWCQFVGAIVLFDAAPLVLPFRNDHSWALSWNPYFFAYILACHYSYTAGVGLEKTYMS